MVVTLEVPKLSGWLNADASCVPRIERGACGAGRAAGSVGGAGGSGGRRCPKQRAQERARLQIGGRARGEERTLNMPFIFVTLEVSKLSGWLNADACQDSKEGHTCGARYAGRQAGGGGRPRRTQRAGEGSTAD